MKEVIDKLRINNKITLVNDEDLVNNKIINDILATMSGKKVPNKLNGAKVVFDPSEAETAIETKQIYDVTITVTKGNQSNIKIFSITNTLNRNLKVTKFEIIKDGSPKFKSEVQFLKIKK